VNSVSNSSHLSHSAERGNVSITTAAGTQSPERLDTLFSSASPRGRYPRSLCVSMRVRGVTSATDYILGASRSALLCCCVIVVVVVVVVVCGCIISVYSSFPPPWRMGG